MRTIRSLPAIMSLLLAVGIAIVPRGVAHANLIVNGGFEAGPDPGPNFLRLNDGSSAISGWVVSGQIDYIGGYWQPAEGGRSLDLNGDAVGGVAQAFTTVPNQTYLVRFAFAGNPDGSNVKQMRVRAAGQSADFCFDNRGMTRSNMGWSDRLWSFTATGSTTTIEFLSLVGGIWGPALDSVVVTVLPPPSTGQPFIIDASRRRIETSKFVVAFNLTCPERVDTLRFKEFSDLQNLRGDDHLPGEHPIDSAPEFFGEMIRGRWEAGGAGFVSTNPTTSSWSASTQDPDHLVVTITTTSSGNPPVETAYTFFRDSSYFLIDRRVLFSQFAYTGAFQLYVPRLAPRTCFTTFRFPTSPTAGLSDLFSSCETGCIHPSWNRTWAEFSAPGVSAIVMYLSGNPDSPSLIADEDADSFSSWVSPYFPDTTYNTDRIYHLAVYWTSSALDPQAIHERYHRIDVQRSNLDADGDGLPDSWETSGIPVAGGSNYILPGANPNHKDLYVEVDAMTGRAPSTADLQRVVAAFDESPVNDPDGQHGIHLHIVGAGCDPCVDESNLSLHDLTNPPWSDIHMIKISHFGTAVEQGNLALLQAKAGAFRYCIFGTSFSDAPNKYRSGNCEGQGQDFFVTLTHFNENSNTRVGTFMHELGHSLGLGHGGGDGINFKPNYYSVMNYTWQMPIAVPVMRQDLQNYQNSWRHDYSRSRLNELDESRLDERLGIGGDRSLWVPVGPLINKHATLVAMGGPVDWDRSGVANNLAFARDVNYIISGGDKPGEILLPHDDWSSLVYLPKESFPPSMLAERFFMTTADSVEEMTPEIYDSLSTLRFDCNGDGFADDEQIASGALADANGDGIPDQCEPPAITAVENAAGIRESRLSFFPEADGSAHGIEYSLFERALITLRVYDLTGRRIASLVDGEEETPGAHRVYWRHVDDTGHHVHSGLYFVELRSRFRRLHGTIVLLK